MRKIQNYIELIRSLIVIDLTAILGIVGYAIANHKNIDEYQVTTGSASFLLLIFWLLLMCILFWSLDRKIGD